MADKFVFPRVCVKRISQTGI